MKLVIGIVCLWLGGWLISKATPPDYSLNWNLVYGLWIIGVPLLLMGIFKIKLPSLPNIKNFYPPRERTEAETRHWFNREESSRAFWCGSDDYIDYDGWLRTIGTNGNDGAYIRDTGNGKNKLYHHSKR